MSKWAEKNGDCEINAFYERAKHVKNVLRLRPYNGPAAERLIARGLYGTTVTGIYNGCLHSAIMTMTVADYAAGLVVDSLNKMHSQIRMLYNFEE